MRSRTNWSGRLPSSVIVFQWRLLGDTPGGSRNRCCARDAVSQARVQFAVATTRSGLRLEAGCRHRISPWVAIGSPDEIHRCMARP